MQQDHEWREMEARVGGGPQDRSLTAPQQAALRVDVKCPPPSAKRKGRMVRQSNFLCEGRMVCQSDFLCEGRMVW